MSRPQECEDCMAAVAAFGGNTCVNCRKDAARGFFDGAAPKTVKAEAVAWLRAADSIARLRATATMHSDFLHIPVSVDDLRALLDAHTEALDALEKLQAAQKHVLEVMCAGEDAYMAACDGAESILAKAGRR